MEEGDESISSDLEQRKFHEALSQLHNKASSILLLTGQGKEISNYFNSVRTLIEGKAKELLWFQESVRERAKQLEKKEEEYELKEKELEKIQDLVRQGLDGMEEKRTELEGVKNFVEDKFREIEAREKEMEGKSRELEGMKQMVEVRLAEIEIKKKNFEEECEEIKLKDEKVVERLKEAEVKEKEIQERCKRLELRETELERKRKDLEGMKQMVEMRMAEIEVKEKTFEEQCEVFKLKDEKLVERLKEIEVKEKEIRDRYKGLEVNEKKFEERCKEFKLRELKVEEQCKVLKLKENQIEERCKEVELERQRITEKYKKLELKREFEEHGGDCGLEGRKTANSQVKIEPKESHSIESATNSMDAKFCSSVTIDGKALQLFLNEHCKEHDPRKNEVEVVLRVSSDPALLVLNALEGFYLPHLKKGDLGFEGSIVRRSCILLLEQLMKISPEILPHVKKQAINIASDWRNKMRLTTGHSLEVLGFLQLVASYGLVSAFNSDKLLAYLWFISQHSKAPELFRILGFSDKISAFIRNLIGKKRRIAAVRFICAFDLVYEFPPGPLLKDHLNDSEIAVKRMSNSNKSLEAQTQTTKERIADLKAVLRCIEDHKIESDLSPKELKEQIDLLEKKISKRKRMLPNPCHMSQLPNPNEKKCLAHKDASAAAGPVFERQFTTNTNRKSPCSSSIAAPTKPIAVTTPALSSAPNKATSPITTISAATTLVPTSSTTVTSPSPSIAPTSGPQKVKAKRWGCKKRHRSQNQKGKKRPRVSRTPEVPLKPYFRDNGYVYPAQPHGQQPVDWFMNQGAPYLNRADRRYDLNGYPSRNSQLDPYYIDSMPYYGMPVPSWRY